MKDIACVLRLNLYQILMDSVKWMILKRPFIAFSMKNDVPRSFHSLMLASPRKECTGDASKTLIHLSEDDPRLFLGSLGLVWG